MDRAANARDFLVCLTGEHFGSRFDAVVLEIDRNVGGAMENASVAVGVHCGDDDFIGLRQEGQRVMIALCVSVSFHATRTVFARTCSTLIAVTSTGRPAPSARLPMSGAKDIFPLLLPVTIRSAALAQELRKRVGLRMACPIRYDQQGHALKLGTQFGKPPISVRWTCMISFVDHALARRDQRRGYPLSQ
jgi:hypothetical protein